VRTALKTQCVKERARIGRAAEEPFNVPDILQRIETVRRNDKLEFAMLTWLDDEAFAFVGDSEPCNDPVETAAGAFAVAVIRYYSSLGRTEVSNHKAVTLVAEVVPERERKVPPADPPDVGEYNVGRVWVFAEHKTGRSTRSVAEPQFKTGQEQEFIAAVCVAL
jgi:hypothetical protein